MRIIADLHIHSKYSRATSRDMCPEVLWKWAQIKGITVMGTGDFTHPAWLSELKEKTEPTGKGLFTLKKEFQLKDIPDSCRADVFFMLSCEISSIYKKNGRTRKVHSIIYVPDFIYADKIYKALSNIGNLHSDGRPILGLDAKELLKIITDICPDSLFVPAHAWTPHFSVFGAVSGFDSLEECFDELAPQICAIETGLSSDPSMNWRLSALDRITLISNSDAHSPAKIGREANILDTECSYKALTDAVRIKKGFLGTIEFFPQEGKYHNDGHRLCKVNFTPKETIAHNYFCPECNREVTVGVMHRVDKLADRENGFKPSGALPFYSIIPLPEILAEAFETGAASKKVNVIYQRLLLELGNEFKILLDISLEDIEKAGSPLIREAISRMRTGNVRITPGFDGEFGKIKIFDGAEREEHFSEEPFPHRYKGKINAD
jgi:uncharacterized protein (TIGR00375 family)